MRYTSLFTGVGGFDLGFDRAGHECVLQVEQDKHALKMLNRHWPDVPKMEDVRDVTRESAGPVDLVCGGFPCQDVSVAGNRKGLDGERSGLWFEFHRILRELTPGWVVIENVPGLFSSNGGRDFATILRGLSEQRYMSSWRVLDSQFFGVPQRRRRIFIVASLGTGRSAEVLFESEGMSRHLAKSRKTRPGAAGEPPAGTGSVEPVIADTLRSGGDGGRPSPRTPGEVVYIPEVNQPIPINTMAATRPESSDQNRQTMGVGEPGDPMYTIQAGHHHAVSAIPIDRQNAKGVENPKGAVRRLTPTECERLQGFPDGWTDGQADSQRYRQMGNAVTVNVAEWIGKRIMANE